MAAGRGGGVIGFSVVFVSGDHRRVMTREVKARDIDNATAVALDMTTSGEFGAKAMWFVGAVVQTDDLALVEAALSGMVG